MLLDLKGYVLEKVPPELYYAKRFQDWSATTKANVTCCFHSSDKTPSLAINLNKGGARCFASSCGKSIGNIVHFEAEATHVEEDEAARNLYSEFIRPIVPPENLHNWQEALEYTPQIRKHFEKVTGLSQASIERFGIGYDARSRRYTFPVYNQFDDCVNVRFYRPKVDRQPNDIKIYSYVSGKGTADEIRYGGIELFNWPALRTFTSAKPLFIMASERETMLAIQLGIQAICSTHGEGSWLDDWTELLYDYEIGIVFDQDKGGDKGADKIIATLQNSARSVARVSLPFIQGYKGDKDFDTWILDKHGNQFQLHKLLREFTSKIPLVHHPSSSETDDLSKQIKSPAVFSEDVFDLSRIRSDITFLNRCVKTKGIVAAVSTKSYDIPWRFKVKTKNGISTITLDVGRDLISLANASDTELYSLLGRHVKSKDLEYESLAYISLSEVEVVPLADIGTDVEGSYTVQRCFVLGGRIESNTPYNLHVIPTTLPKTQEKVLIIVEKEEISRALDILTFDEQSTRELAETFCLAENETVFGKLESLANEIAANHTRIYARPDWHIVALLSWFCPIGWYFPGESDLQRGWINSLAIGDTQTGKSKVIATLQQLLKMGDIVNAENCTFVGLVGGAIKTSSGQMMLRWGRLPLCDRKLVIIEELSGLSVNDISNMSEVRSRGIARLDKGGLASQTPARTRLIALSNVRPMQRNLAQYLSGVKAIQELIGHPEDISRFDLIVTLIDNEVESDIINSTKDETITPTFQPEQLQRLCQFVWALKPNQVQFSDSAYIACLNWTKELQRLYHPSVPIFKAASGRLLLARIGAAIASLQFNWNGESIIIEDSHIDAAADLLRSLYDKPSFGYLEYSKQMQARESVQETVELRKSIRDNLNPTILLEVFDALIHAAKFSRDELAAIASIQLFQADDLVGHLLRANIIRKGEANTWEITKPGKAWMLKQIKQ